MPLLHHAAYLSSIEVPQPAYVYALLLMQEFPHVTLPQQLLLSLIPQSHPTPVANPSIPPPSLMSESRKYLERSAYLNFGPALYKLGQSYEHALPPFTYDPLMSVQYYSFASQTGNALADLALSKWFLVGSKPDPADPNAPAESFDKDESLALIFAEKAALKGEAGGEFAMGYYSEVGIGRNGKGDLNQAREWYERAAKQGYQDAKDRLKELARDNPKLIGAQEHQGRLERMRTNAKERMKASGTGTGVAGSGGLAPPVPGQPASSSGLLTPSGANVMALARNSSRMNHGGSGRRANMQDFEAASTTAPAPEKSSAPATAGGLAPSSATTTSPAGTGGKTATTTAGGKAKPATFEEMGYHSQKLEDKECIIM